MATREEMIARREALWAEEARLEGALEAQGRRLDRFFEQAERALAAEVEIWRGRLARQRDEVLRHCILNAQENLEIEESESKARISVALKESWWAADFMVWVETNQRRWGERAVQKAEGDLRAVVDVSVLTRLFDHAPLRPNITPPTPSKIHKVETPPAPRSEARLPSYAEQLLGLTEGFTALLGAIGTIVFLNRFNVEDNQHLLSLLMGLGLIGLWFFSHARGKREAARRQLRREGRAVATRLVRQRLEDQLNHQRDRLDRWLSLLHHRWISGLDLWREAEVTPLYERSQQALSLELRRTRAQIEALNARLLDVE
ncbi:hypothetical protein KKF91_05525 [Myxococcota bacterium]|nr:hypothetical protein [Myxococcota bacterium]MBU1430009.1 hypothetical protein [Myxococcota bacterium]MBU1899848.1 hypothetical protein [Myxococcota bacterium]